MEIQEARKKDFKKRLNDHSFYGTAIALIALSAIDFTIHHNGGLSDPEIRSYFQSRLGDWIKFIGDFGLSAAMTIPTVTALKIAKHSETIIGEMDLTDRFVEVLSHFAPACIFAIVLAVEGFRGNNQFIGDSAMSLAGIIAAQTTTNEVLHRFNFGRHHNIRARVDPLFPLKSIPTSLPQWQYQAI